MLRLVDYIARATVVNAFLDDQDCSHLAAAAYAKGGISAELLSDLVGNNSHADPIKRRDDPTSPDWDSPFNRIGLELLRTQNVAHTSG